MESPDPSTEEIDELLRFLPKLYAEDFEALKEMHSNYPDGALSFPHAEYAPLVYEFFEAAQKPCWSDYSYQIKESARMLEDNEFAESASLAQIKTMMTYCVRGERFCSGHWGAMIEDGKIKALLERLKVISNTGNVRQGSQPS